jgi:hypothetical protein
VSSRLALPIATLLALALPAIGEAATVSTTAGPVLSYVAGASEANRLVISYSAEGNSAVVSDPGATVTAGAGCVAIDAHSARCGTDDGGVGDLPARVSLGDGDDTIAVVPPTEPHYNDPTIDGGPGNDTLAGTPGNDVISGGGGTDTISGGDGDDKLSDGDSALADADVLDGGPGEDRVSYAGRATAVVVDLAGGGEDTLTGIDWVVGGDGGDTISGAGDAERLDGGAGDDTLGGRGGDDRLVGGADNDMLRGGAGDDTLAGLEGRDEFACGAGTDAVIEPALGILVPTSCELGRFYNSRSFQSRRDSTIHPLQSRGIAGGAALMRLRCANDSSNDFGEFNACWGRLVIREAGGRHRMLAEARFDNGRRGHFNVRAKLTAVGRRVLAAPGTVRATAFVSGGVPRDYRWTFLLRP